MIKMCNNCNHSTPHPILGDLLIKCEIKRLYERCNAWLDGMNTDVCGWYDA